MEASGGALLISSEWGVAGPNLAVIESGTVTPQMFRLSSAPPPLRNDIGEGGHVQLGHVTVDAEGQRWALANRYLLRLAATEANIAWSTRGPDLWALYADPADPDAVWLGDSAGGVYRYDRRRDTVTDALQATTSHLNILWMKRLSGAV